MIMQQELKSNSHNIPNELINNIISYVPNIDIRRNFDIYHKINDNKYNILNTIIRKEREENNISFKRYYCKENIFFTQNKNNPDPLLDDIVDLIYKEQNNNIHIEIHIWKLIKKDKNFISHRNDGMYYIGDYEDDYYWKDIVIKYSL